MRRLGLLPERMAEEEKLISAAPEAAPILKRLDEIYGQLRAGAGRSEVLEAVTGIYAGSSLLAAAHALYENSLEAQKPDAERETAFRARNLPFLVKRLTKRIKDIHPPHEAALLRRAASICSTVDAELAAAAPSLSKLEAVA